MKNKKFFQDQNQTPASASPVRAAASAGQNKMSGPPSADEVARRAYFNYVNEGSRPGHDVQDWLAAEAHLLAERNRAHTHGVHNLS